MVQTLDKSKFLFCFIVCFTIVPVDERDENELYRTYSSLIDRSQILSSQLNNLSHKCKELETHKVKHFDTL